MNPSPPQDNYCYSSALRILGIFSTGVRASEVVTWGFDLQAAVQQAGDHRDGAQRLLQASWDHDGLLDLKAPLIYPQRGPEQERTQPRLTGHSHR